MQSSLFWYFRCLLIFPVISTNYTCSLPYAHLTYWEYCASYDPPPLYQVLHLVLLFSGIPHSNWVCLFLAPRHESILICYFREGTIIVQKYAQFLNQEEFEKVNIQIQKTAIRDKPLQAAAEYMLLNSTCYEIRHSSKAHTFFNPRRFGKRITPDTEAQYTGSKSRINTCGQLWNIRYGESVINIC